MAEVAPDTPGEPLIGGRGYISVLSQRVLRDDDKGDIVVVLPIKMSADHCKLHEVQAKDQSIPKMNGKNVDWEDTIRAEECLTTAQKIFNRYNREEKAVDADLPTCKAKLAMDFNRDMTRLEFHGKIVQRLVDLLAGHKIALEINTMLSADHDEMFLCLRVPENNERFDRMCANSEGYRVQIDPQHYKSLDLFPKQKFDCPQVMNKDCTAWEAYQDEEAQYFMPFRPMDRLRLMRRRIAHFITWSEAERAGVVQSTFVVHKWDELEKLNATSARFSDIKYFYKPPDPKDMDNVKEYFGEEAAYFFHWFAYYIRALAVPAFIGLILFFRRYWGLSVVKQRVIQDGYAICMAMWTAYFCETYSRLSLRQATIWGTRNYDMVASVRPDYKDEATHRTSRWQKIGGALMSIFLFLIVSGIIIIQTFRATMIHHPHEVMLTNIIAQEVGRPMAVKCGAKFGAILITMQIKTLDFIWGKIATWITNQENQKTDVRWQKSFIFKTVFVKFFNAMYPFIYYAFAKEYVEGCRIPDMPHATDEEKLHARMSACISGLQLYIMTFFGVHISIVCAMLCKRLVFARYKIQKERSKPGVDEYTYLQLQAKTDAFHATDMVNDYMEATVQFGLVVCFSVVLPVLTLLSIISNLLEYRLVAYRQSYIVQRVHPSGAEGIGAWLEFFRIIAYMAIVINAGLAVFAMLPFKAFSMEAKLLLFLCFEHGLMFLKLAVETSIPDMPRDVDTADDKNDEAVTRIFGGAFKRMHFEESEFGTRKAIRCNVDGARWFETYEHCDLSTATAERRKSEQMAANEKEETKKVGKVNEENAE